MKHGRFVTTSPARNVVTSAAGPIVGTHRGQSENLRRLTAPIRHERRRVRLCDVNRPPERLYLAESEWREQLDNSALARLTPFNAPEGTPDAIEIGAHAGRNFAPERGEPGKNVFEAVTRHVGALQSAGKRPVIALWSEGSRDRMGSMLRDHKLAHLTSVNTWRTVQATPRNEAMLAVVGMESGFETDDVAVISEQDILGDRLVRPRKASRKLDNFISEVTSLASGDLVVHVEHGIGRFDQVARMTVDGAEREYARRRQPDCRQLSCDARREDQEQRRARQCM